MPARHILVNLAIGLPLIVVAGKADAQPATATDAKYTARVMTAAPPQIVRNATIVRTVNGAMQTLKKGTNDFTCMENNGTPMCMDPNAMEWAHAWQTHAPPPDKIGFIYMLNGDVQNSYTDPFDRTSPAITGSRRAPRDDRRSRRKTMAGYPRAADADPTKPYVMWPGTPYEHLMLPVK
jgi:hypothetical protein